MFTAKQTLEYHNLSLTAKIEKKEARLAYELEQYQKEVIHVLTELMEATSDETGRHIRRVAEFSRLLAVYYPKLTDEDAEVIYHAAPMHDIGKIAIPHDIIHKPGKLTAEEYETMKLHTVKAHRFLGYSKRLIMKSADIIAYQHHEKWDGTGYPRGLSGEDIHIFGRIVAIADVFDALTHKRAYKDAWPIDEAVDYITNLKGTHFDPELVEIFLEHLDEFEAIIEA